MKRRSFSQSCFEFYRHLIGPEIEYLQWSSRNGTGIAAACASVVSPTASGDDHRQVHRQIPLRETAAERSARDGPARGLLVDEVASIRSQPVTTVHVGVGGAFEFPEDDEEDKGGHRELCMSTQEKTEDEEDEEESVTSVESKLRYRLGLATANGSKLEVKENLREKAAVVQSWGSADWSSVGLEEEDTDALDDEDADEENPEEVIERVRKRLGWSTSSSSLPTPRLRPIELRLSIGNEEKQLMRPPLSPQLDDRSVDRTAAKHSHAWAWSEQERGENYKQPDGVLTARDSAAKDDNDGYGAKGWDERGEDELKAGLYEQTSAVEESKVPSQHSDLSPLEGGSTRTVIYQIRQSSSFNQKPEALKSAKVIDPGAIVGARQVPSIHSEELPSREMEKEDSNLNHNKLENPMIEQEGGMPLLRTKSPTRPGLDLTDADCENMDTSAPSKGQGETTKETLDSLVSFVVHSWSLESAEFIAKQKVNEPTPDHNNRRNDADTVTPNGIHSNIASSTADLRCLPPGSRKVVNEEPAAPLYQKDDAEELAEIQRTSKCDFFDCDDGENGVGVEGQPAYTIQTSESDLAAKSPADSWRLNKIGKSFCYEDARYDDSEEEIEKPVPGEEDDEIAQMLMHRIASLEEALLRLDS